MPMPADDGHANSDGVMPTNDYLGCPRQTLKTSDCLLRDVNNNTINLHGANLSFSIIFGIQHTVV